MLSPGYYRQRRFFPLNTAWTKPTLYEATPAVLRVVLEIHTLTQPQPLAPRIVLLLEILYPVTTELTVSADK